MQALVHTRSAPVDKRETLRHLIRSAENLKNAIIFCNRKTEVALLYKSLVRHGFAAVALHGDMDQRSRMAALESFRNGEMTLLVASDVAARGLDIPDVSHVFNFDVPIHADDYVHRIGRTGRAGRAGWAFTLASPADRKYVAAIEALTGMPIAWTGDPLPDDGQSDEEKPRRGRHRGRDDAGREPRAAAGRTRAPSRASEKRQPRTGPPRTRGRPGPARPRTCPPRRRLTGRHPPAAAATPDIAPSRSCSQAADRGRAAVRPAPEPRVSRSQPEPRPARSHPEPHGQRRDEPAVLGLGDHVPSFLLQPIRRKAR